MKVKDKKAVKKVYDFVKKYDDKIVKKSLDLGNGVKGKVEYTLLYDGCDYVFVEDSKYVKLTYPKVFTDIMKLFGGVDDYQFPYDLVVDLGVDEVNNQLDTLIELADLVDDGDWIQFMTECDSFNEFWTELEKEFEDPNAPQPVVINLSRDYDAIIKKGSNLVEVGCQRIPIETVRKIVESYDAL